MSKAATTKSDASALLFKRENPSNPTREQVQLTVDERIKNAKEQERESRKAALRTLNETKATAVQTNTDLINQGERIKKMQDATAQIHDDMNVSEKFLRSIGSIWGALSNKFRDDNSAEHKSARSEYEAQFSTSSGSDNANNISKKTTEKPTKPTKVKIDIKSFETSMKEVDVPHEITDPDLKSEYEEFVRESDADLDEMLNGMKELKGIAYGMNGQIRDHNRRLTDLQSDVDLANSRIKASTLKAKKLT
jgi:hypothetical protein